MKERSTRTSKNKNKQKMQVHAYKQKDKKKKGNVTKEETYIHINKQKTHTLGFWTLSIFCCVRNNTLFQKIKVFLFSE